MAPITASQFGTNRFVQQLILGKVRQHLPMIAEQMQCRPGRSIYRAEACRPNRFIGIMPGMVWCETRPMSYAVQYTVCVL